MDILDKEMTEAVKDATFWLAKCNDDDQQEIEEDAKEEQQEIKDKYPTISRYLRS